MGGHPEAGGQAKHGACVLRDIRLVEGDCDHHLEAKPWTARIVKAGREPGDRSEG
jgi:hypothetical protein